MILLLSFLSAMLISMALIPPLMKGAARWRIVDLPNERKAHVGAIPRVGGIAMAAGALVPMLLWLPMQREITGLVAGLVVILAFGIWDDRRDLDYRLKFLGQTIAIVAIVFYGGIGLPTLDLPGLDRAPDWVGDALGVFVLLAVTNAVNLSDGLDGLAGGTSLLSLGFIAVLAGTAQDTSVALPALAITGGILGFLRFNTHPARVFMGDAGSQFLGLTLGTLALMLTRHGDAGVSPALPLLLLGLPLLDTAMVMTYRLAHGRSPFSADRNHIHHRLLALGLDHYAAVFVLYVLQAALTVVAYVLRRADDAWIVAAYGLFCIAVAGFFYGAERGGWRVQGKWRLGGLLLQRLGRDGQLVRLAHLYVLAALPAYLMVGAVLAPGTSQDVALLSLALLAIMAVKLVLRRGATLSWLERGLIYAAAAVVLYVTEGNADLTWASDAFFGVLAAAVVLGLRWSPAAGFAATPLDFLVVFAAIALSALPEGRDIVPGWTAHVPKLVVLYFGIEMALSRLSGRVDAARAVACLTLFVIGLRGLL